MIGLACGARGWPQDQGGQVGADGSAGGACFRFTNVVFLLLLPLLIIIIENIKEFQINNTFI